MFILRVTGISNNIPSTPRPSSTDNNNDAGDTGINHVIINQTKMADAQEEVAAIEEGKYGPPTSPQNTNRITKLKSFFSLFQNAIQSGLSMRGMIVKVFEAVTNKLMGNA